MNSKLAIGEGVPAAIEPDLRRQIRVKTASLDASVASLSTRLEVDDASQPGWLVCLMQARLVSGATYHVETRGLRPEVCVADAASRLVRAIGRDQKLAPVRRPVFRRAQNR